ncbi:ABC transporter permease [Bacillus subtilis]|nr:ABC transporter permease [Bacillus subtilis]
MHTADPTTLPATVSPSRPKSRIGLFVALAWLAAVILGALFSTLIPALDPLRADFGATLAPPSIQHWFGTDATGRDVFARTLAGGRSSLIVAGLTVLIGLIGGGLLGVLAGYFRGMDSLIGIVVDLMLAFPALILIMAIVSFVGADYWTIGALIGILSIPAFTRLARSATITVRQRDFVHAARIMGATSRRVLLAEIIPNVLPAIGAYSFVAVTGAIVVEGSLSFLGFGLQPPIPSWGSLIAEGRSHFASAPWITAAPALVLCATVLALNYIGQRASRP